MHALMSMPEQTRAVLQAFLAMASKPDTISVTVDQHGRVTLYSPEVEQTTSILRSDAGKVRSIKS
jgi:hypothetical protein